MIPNPLWEHEGEGVPLFDPHTNQSKHLVHLVNTDLGLSQRSLI